MIVEASISAEIKTLLDSLTSEDPATSRQDLADGLAKAIKNAIISATVQVTITGVNAAGQTVLAPPPSGAGVTTSPGTVTGNGSGTLS